MHRPEGKGLAAGTLGLWGSTVIGLASTAPVYSLVATLGFVVLAVGAQAPIAFVIAFVPMLFIAFAYRELNNEIPDCGTTFTWATKAFGPWVGWMGGWGVALAGIVVLANLAQVAGIYFWALIDAIVSSPEDALLAENVPLVTATGVVFIALMTWISWRGIEIGERIQNVLLAIQYLALAIFVVAALWHFFAGTAPDPTPFDWSWFNPFAFTEWSGFVEAVLLALFIYWGWDTCLALNEETKDPKRIPGRAALLTTVILLVTYVSVTVAAMMYAGLGDTGTGLGNKANADDFFLAVKDGLLGPVGWVLVVAVMISAISSTQTTILPTARGTLAMAAYKALPKRFSTVHPVYKTPSFSTLVMGAVAIVYYVGMTLISEQHPAGLDPLARPRDRVLLRHHGICVCLVLPRELFTSGRNFLYKFLLPLLGALMLTYAFVQSAIDMYAEDYGDTSLWGIGGTFLLGIGSLAFGVVLMLIWFAFPRSKPFFRGESLNRETPVLVPEDPADFYRSIDGGLA